MRRYRRGFIDKLNSDGYGVCVDGAEEFAVPYTLQGEEIEFFTDSQNLRQSSIRKSYFKGIITPSTLRSPSFCEYYTKCGGCTMQHMNKEIYRQLQLQGLAQLEDPKNIEFIQLRNSARRKINLRFVQKKDKLLLGLCALASNDIITIESCPASEESISRIIPYVSSFLQQNLNQKDRGELFILMADNGITLQIYINSDQVLNLDISRKFKSLCSKIDIISGRIYLNHNLRISHDNQVPYITFGGNIQVPVTADCFLQATKESDKIIADFILNILKTEDGARSNISILDLFCGRGTISIPLALSDYQVHAFDFDESAISALANSTQNLNITIYKRDLMYNPIKDMLLNADCIILNPPRRGAQEQIKEIIASKEQGAPFTRVIYVSCSKESFVKDSIRLMQSGFTIEKIAVLDQFKWTPNVEILCSFTI